MKLRLKAAQKHIYCFFFFFNGVEKAQVKPVWGREEGRGGKKKTSLPFKRENIVAVKSVV